LTFFSKILALTARVHDEKFNPVIGCTNVTDDRRDRQTDRQTGGRPMP